MKENEILKSTYNPKDFEEDIYRKWESKGYFRPSMDKSKKHIV